MRKAYNVLGWIIAGLVMLQAAAIAWGVGGEGKFVEEGGVVDKALIEAAQAGGEPPFPEVFAFPIHGINGGMLIPLVGLVLMGVSFGAHLPHARRNAGIVLALIALQVTLGYSISDLPALGFLHGLNALLLFAAALVVARHRDPAVVDGSSTSAAGTDSMTSVAN